MYLKDLLPKNNRTNKKISKTMQVIEIISAEAYKSIKISRNVFKIVRYI